MSSAANHPSWNVRIEFADGEFTARASAETRERAFYLALVDARMGHPFGSFMSKVLSWDAVPA